MIAVNRKRRLQPGERVRVLVVDDSVVVRRALTHLLEEDPLLEVAGSAANGAIALRKIAQLRPDVVTLDIEMPEINGLEALKQIRRDFPQTRVIMCSALTHRGAEVTLQALTIGADDYVEMNASEGPEGNSLSRLRAELLPRIRQFFELPDAIGPVSSLAKAPAASPATRVDPCLKSTPKVLAIGVSTGGPTALAQLLPGLPADYPLPVVLVQHMPPLFTRLLAERLSASCALDVEEAARGSVVAPGKVLIAPGDFHMKVARSGSGVETCLDQSPPLNSCRPAVDALFQSVAEVYGGAAIAVVLTGMGQDGLRGAEILRNRGATVLAQDESTSVVWGMPGAVVNAGLADRVLPLGAIVPEILRLTRWNQA